MPLKENLFICNYFPINSEKIPFKKMLNEIFFNPDITQNMDYPIHGPNSIRFLEALVKNKFMDEPGLIKKDKKKNNGGERFRDYYYQKYQKIAKLIGAFTPEKRENILALLKVGILYHDIGKFIRRANHPPIGINLIRNYDKRERQKLVDALVYEDEDDHTEAKYNRFSLIASIIQHHDKFGVVTTGEGGLPLFSDILYFTSDSSSVEGIKKNITSVMLANLSDIAAVCVASDRIKKDAFKKANEIYRLRKKKKIAVAEEERKLDALLNICKDPGSCLGLTADKISRVLEDWETLVDLIEPADGNRMRLKQRLLEFERNPARAIKRILRLLQECAETSKCDSFIGHRFMSPANIESILVGTLGSHQFQNFCDLLATVVKMDYGLRFFRAIMCASVRQRIIKKYKPKDDKRKKRDWEKLSPEEQCSLENDLSDDAKSEVLEEITTLFIKTIEGLLNRYIGVLGHFSNNPRRFGFQMSALISDDKIRETIIDLLCVKKNKEHYALTWLVDEVTIWSLD